MRTYKKIKDKLSGEIYPFVERDDLTQIPFDPANTDYQEYLKWVAEGNEPLPADQPDTLTNQNGG